VTRLLFPERAAENAQNLHHHGMAQVIGRQALVVEMRLEDGARHRAWVDALTGVVLRWQRYDPADPRTLVEEVILTSIEFDADFPDESYSSYFFDPQRFIWENEWRRFILGRKSPAPPLESSFGSRQTQEQRPGTEGQMEFFAPGGSNAARSRLSFQWQPEPDESPDPTRPDKWAAQEWSAQEWAAQDWADLFAGDTYLGRVMMGDPWNLFCERSPDGSRIAFVNPPRGPQGLYMAEAGPFWFDLSSPAEIHNALPNATVVSSDFAFSPDGEWLAFWGCGGSEENCGVYIQNTRTSRTVKLFSLSFAHLLHLEPGRRVAGDDDGGEHPPGSAHPHRR
jgi:hypothetical protein